MCLAGQVSAGDAWDALDELVDLGLLLDSTAGRYLYAAGYSGDDPGPAQGTAIQSHNDEDQSTLQR